MPKTIPYGIGNYAEMVETNAYFVDKTPYDVSTRYTNMMQEFVNNPNLERLFAGYWRDYVSQLPEDVKKLT